MPPRERGEAATGRGVWSGSLSFGLVSVPVELVAATRRARPALRMLAPDGEPLERQYVCPEHDERLDAGEIARGYPVGRDEYVVVTDEELAALAPRRSRDIELERFVKRDEIPVEYFVRSYFLVPDGETTKAYRLLSEVMESEGRAAIGHFVMHDSAHAVAIFSDGGLLRAELLRFGDEVRDPAALGKAGRAEPRRVAKMRKAIGALAKSALDERELADDAPAQLIALARKKLGRGEDVVEAQEGEGGEGEAEPGEVIDLVRLLKQRMKSRAPKRAAQPRSRRRKRAK